MEVVSHNAVRTLHESRTRRNLPSPGSVRSMEEHSAGSRESDRKRGRRGSITVVADKIRKKKRNIFCYIQARRSTFFPECWQLIFIWYIQKKKVVFFGRGTCNPGSSRPSLRLPLPPRPSSGKINVPTYCTYTGTPRILLPIPVSSCEGTFVLK